MRFLSKFLIPFFLFSTCFGTPFIPINTCPCSFSIDGEWLYFSVPSESRTFAIIVDIPGGGSIGVPENNSGLLKTVELDEWFSGYRASLAYTFSNCTRYAAVTWTGYKAENSRNLVGGASNFFLTNFPPNLVSSGIGAGPFATADQEFKYYSVDGIFGQRYLRDCWIDLDLFGGGFTTPILSRTEMIFSPPVEEMEMETFTKRVTFGELVPKSDFKL